MLLWAAVIGDGVLIARHRGRRLLLRVILAATIGFFVYGFLLLILRNHDFIEVSRYPADHSHGSTRSNWYVSEIQGDEEMMEHVPTWVLFIVPHGLMGLCGIVWIVAYCVSPTLRAFHAGHIANHRFTWAFIVIHFGVWSFAAQGTRDDLLFYSGFLVAFLAMAAVGFIKMILEWADSQSR